MEKLKEGDVIYYESNHGTGRLTVGRVQKETPKRVKARLQQGTAIIKKEAAHYEPPITKDIPVFKEIGGEYRWWRKVTPEIQKRIEEQGIEIPGPREPKTKKNITFKKL